jgi:NAD(P)-dependent dehydrogenase (short-subunit alcohol dehydrogenase family)
MAARRSKGKAKRKGAGSTRKRAPQAQVQVGRSGQRHFPRQRQSQPGRQHRMRPRPSSVSRQYKPSGRLKDKVALITGGDSGIGRAVAVLYAKEGADVAIAYLEEDKDAARTKALVEAAGRKCLLLRGDVGRESFCKEAVERTVQELGRLDVLVNNAAEQHFRDPAEGIADIAPDDLERTFRTNIFSHFYLVKAGLPHLEEGSSIINTTSVVAYKGNPSLLDYACTKGAQVAFTRSLAQGLVEKGIRVNGVAPGPVWTPLIPATFPKEEVEDFAEGYPLGAAQPEDVAPTYVFLACDDGSFYTGQVLHPNSGKVVGG